MNPFQQKILNYLAIMYDGEIATKVAEQIQEKVAAARMRDHSEEPVEKWSEKDTILITYGDSIIDDENPPLKNLELFLQKHLAQHINCVHILPFFPYSSDDGFSVIDYKQVAPDLGNWEHINALGKGFKLMFDLVLNHISQESSWFQGFLAGDAKYRDFFVEVDPENFDTTNVVRPRASSPMVSVKAGDQETHVWATFSHDQIDLNFDNPAVLLEVIDIILFYIQNKAQFMRLDAVGFLFKRSGTACIHLPETHAAVRLIREIAEAVQPSSVIVTETNVPNRENLSYFGNGNEAHMIYNFSLPPLVLHALVKGTSSSLKAWMMSMPPSPPGCCYFNFTASHDGIGLRPLEGLITKEETNELIEVMKRHDAQISYRAAANGDQVPYEINVSLFDALKGNTAGIDNLQVERFLCSQTIMMGLEGIPAFYIHSLLATENDLEGMQARGHNRAINRRRWNRTELENDLEQNKQRATVFNTLREIIQKRTKQPAFHPNATQFTIQLGDEIFAFWRQSLDRKQSIFCIHNVTAKPVHFKLTDINLVVTDQWFDILSDQQFEESADKIVLQPYACMWISNKQEDL